MPVPQFTEMLLPILEELGRNQQQTFRKFYREVLPAYFKLSEADLAEKTPKSHKGKVGIRAAWALICLKNTGLVENIERGVWGITALGRKLLATKPSTLSVKAVEEFADANGYIAKGRDALQERGTRLPVFEAVEKTPQELIEESSEILREALAKQVLNLLLKVAPGRFEEIVMELLKRMGYGGSEIEAIQVVGKVGDGGIDGIIREDKLGLEYIYVQAKRWEHNVSSGTVRDFVGALAAHHSNKGILMTTSDFTKDAKEYVKKLSQKVVLIDGFRLAGLMIEFELGVSTSNTFAIKRLDSDYFEEE